MNKIEYAFLKALEIIEITNASDEDCVENLKSIIIDTIKKTEDGEFVAEPIKKAKILIEHIINVTCNYFEIKQEVFQSNTRKREIVVARQLAHYFAKKYTKLSLAKIGDEIGGKDHNTVRHSVKTVNNLKDTDKEYHKKFLKIRDVITGNERTEALPPKTNQNDYNSDSKRDLR